MPLSINTNMMAMNSARHLGENYGALSASVQRLSSGLRINSSADDAAGLAIRELMRSDITAYRQGMRNCNDAVSMVQTADGALGIIDEKLIRMKELAEQAATGTYSSDQRLMIDSEFQAMAAEIDRIANATEFNGVHLLNGNLQGEHNGEGLASSGAAKIHFGPGNDSAEDYYYINIGACNVRSLLYPDILTGWPGAVFDGNSVVFSVSSVVAGAGEQAVPGMKAIDSYSLPVGLENIVMRSRNSVSPFYHKPHISLFTNSGKQLTGVDPQGTFAGQSGSSWWNSMTQAQVVNAGKTAGLFSPSASYDNAIINAQGETVEVGGMEVEILTKQSEADGEWEEITVSTITSDLVFLIGGHDNPGGGCNVYDLEIRAEVNISIATQQAAQQMLERISTAIGNKDAIRAHLGAMQNRLENTISNLAIQAENLQAAESRISDVDVAGEMTDFVSNQILTQSATAMLAQANSMPRMALQLMQG